MKRLADGILAEFELDMLVEEGDTVLAVGSTPEALAKFELDPGSRVGIELDPGERGRLEPDPDVGLGFVLGISEDDPSKSAFEL